MPALRDARRAGTSTRSLSACKASRLRAFAPRRSIATLQTAEAGDEPKAKSFRRLFAGESGEGQPGGLQGGVGVEVVAGPLAALEAAGADPRDHRGVVGAEP